LNTLVLEAGGQLTPEKDYVEHVPAWEARFRGMGERKQVGVDQAVQQTCTGMDEWNSKFFVNDKENPYTTDPEKPFLWIRGRQVEAVDYMGRQTYRWSDFGLRSKTCGKTWGLTGRFVIRILRLGTNMSRISSHQWPSRRLPQLPDSKFLPPMEMSCAEVVVKEAIAKHFPGERMNDHGRCAILDSSPSRPCGMSLLRPCSRGVSHGRNFSSLNSTLPAAQATGKLTLRLIAWCTA